eukprot:g16608.t1
MKKYAKFFYILLLLRGRWMESAVDFKRAMVSLWFWLSLCHLCFTSHGMPVGVNLPSITSEFPYVFKDLFKHSKVFNLDRYSFSSLVMDENGGYPIYMEPGTTAYTSIGQDATWAESGQYVCLYDGEGQLSFELDGTKIEESPGRILVQVVPNQGIRIRITRTNSSNHVRNIRLVRAEHEASYMSAPFSPVLLSLLEGFDVLRVTHPQGMGKDTVSYATWAEKPQYWSQRRKTSAQTQVTNVGESGSYRTTWRSNGENIVGIAVEHLVDLVNTLHVDIWVGSPQVNTTSPEEDFVKGLAVYIRDNIHSGATVYVELGDGDTGSSIAANMKQTLLAESVWRAVWAAGDDSSRLVFVAHAAPYWPNMWASYGSNLSRVDAIGDDGNIAYSYGVTITPFSAQRSWPQNNSNITLDEVLDIVARAAFYKEMLLTENLHRAHSAPVTSDNPNLQVLASAGGAWLQSVTFGARDANTTATRCMERNTFPCNLNWPYRPERGEEHAWDSWSVPNLTTLNASMESIMEAAAREQRLEDLLINASRHERMFGILFDFMRRWDRLGAGAYVLGDLWYKPIRTASKMSGSQGLMEHPLRSSRADSPKFAAVRAFMAWQDDHSLTPEGALPFTSADLPVHPPLSATCAQPCVWGTCYHGVCECFFGASGSRCESLDAHQDNRCHETDLTPGIEVSGIADWSRQKDFVDQMKRSRGWITNCMGPSCQWGYGPPINLTVTKDYPWKIIWGQAVGTMMMRDVEMTMESGTYVVLYDGDGVFRFQFDIKDVRRAAGRIEVDVELSLSFNNGFYLELLWTDENNPVRNIRVMPKEYEERVRDGDFPFYPSFLYNLIKYKLIRYMDWMKTNTVQDVSSWATRPTPSTARTYGSVDPLYYGERDNMVPVESMVLLSNSVGAHPWFNIPHLASDDWVRSFATLVRDTLRPDLDVYLEWSNEVWHSGFPGGKYAQEQGLIMGLDKTHTYWFGDSAEARHCFLAWTTANVSKIFEQVFGGRSRLHVVISAQQIHPITGDKILSCKDAYKHVEHLGVSGYWSGLNLSATLDENMDIYLPKGIEDMKALLVGHQAVAAKYNVTLVGYEVGASMVAAAQDGKDTDLAIATNRDVRVRPLAVAGYEAMLEAGMRTFIQFTFVGAFSRYGSYSILEASDQLRLRAPKFLAYEDFLNNHRLPNCNYTVYDNCPGGGHCTSGQGQCLQNQQCDCFHAFSGPGCEVATFAFKYDCGYKCTFDQGSCSREENNLLDMVKTYKCECEEGFSGPACALFECQHACSFAGECVDIDVCSCFPGFAGFWCEIDCGCMGHGICNSDHTCNCDQGWKWSETYKVCELSCPCEVCSAPGVCGCPKDSCKYGDCVGGGCQCWEGASGSDCSVLTPATRTNFNSTVGTDVGGLAYWSTAWAFIDVAKQAEDRWTSNCLSEFFSDLDPEHKERCKWNNDMPQDLRPDGYPARLQPGQTLGRLMVRNVGLRGVSGRYVVLYEGVGRLDFGMDAQIVSRAFGRLEVDVTLRSYPVCEQYYDYLSYYRPYCGENGIWVNIVKTNPQNPIRNIRVVMPGFEATHVAQPFHPWFLRALLPFSTLRFMGWQNINSDPAAPHAFEERTLPTSMAQTSPKGAALEYVVHLCNMVAAHCWINIPHWATDDYVTGMATLVKNSLRPDVKVYVEWSNEVWNPGFVQYSYAVEEGKKLNYHLNPPSELTWMGSGAANAAAAYRFQAYRHVQVAKLWRNVFSAAANTRLFFVLSTWTLFASTTATFLHQLQEENVASGGSGLVHAIGVAGYFCGEMGYNSQKADTQSMSVEAILTACGSQSTLDDWTASLEAHKTAISPLELPLITYEAGPSIMEASVIGDGYETVSLTKKFIAVHRAPAMESVYDSYLAAAKRSGLMSKSTPYMHFVATGKPSRYGSWAALEFTGQDHLPTSFPAPKYKSLLKYAFPSTAPRSCIRSLYGSVSGARISVHAPSTYGQPGVLQPGPDSVWVLGEPGQVQWDVSWAGAEDPNAKVDIWLWQGANCDFSMREFDAARKAQRALQLAKGVSRAKGKATVSIPKDLIVGAYFVEVVGVSTEFAVGAANSQAGNFSSIVAITARYVWEVPPPSEGGGKPAADSSNSNSLVCVPNKLIARVPRATIAPFCSLSTGSSCVTSPTTVTCPKWSVVNFAESSRPCMIDRVGCRDYRTARTGYHSSFKPVKDCTAVDSPHPSLVKPAAPPVIAEDMCQAKVTFEMSLTLPGGETNPDVLEGVLAAVQSAVSEFLGINPQWIVVNLVPAESGAASTPSARRLLTETVTTTTPQLTQTLAVRVSVIVQTDEIESAVAVSHSLSNAATNQSLQTVLTKQAGAGGALLNMTLAPFVSDGVFGTFALSGGEETGSTTTVSNPAAATGGKKDNTQTMAIGIGCAAGFLLLVVLLGVWRAKTRSKAPQQTLTSARDDNNLAVEARQATAEVETVAPRRSSQKNQAVPRNSSQKTSSPKPRPNSQRNLIQVAAASDMESEIAPADVEDTGVAITSSEQETEESAVVRLIPSPREGETASFSFGTAGPGALPPAMAKSSMMQSTTRTPPQAGKSLKPFPAAQPVSRSNEPHLPPPIVPHLVSISIWHHDWRLRSSTSTSLMCSVRGVTNTFWRTFLYPPGTRRSPQRPQSLTAGVDQPRWRGVFNYVQGENT